MNDHHLKKKTIKIVFRVKKGSETEENDYVSNNNTLK